MQGKTTDTMKQTARASIRSFLAMAAGMLALLAIPVIVLGQCNVIERQVVVTTVERNGAATFCVMEEIPPYLRPRDKPIFRDIGGPCGDNKVELELAVGQTRQELNQKYEVCVALGHNPLRIAAYRIAKLLGMNVSLAN